MYCRKEGKSKQVLPYLIPSESRLPSPSNCWVAGVSLRGFLDLFRVYFCTTILARAIGFGFGSATTQVLQWAKTYFVQCPGTREEKEREREKENADWS